MAEQVLTDVGIWIDGVDYAGVSNSVGIDLTAAAPVSTRFKGGWVRRAAGGLKTAALSMEGFLDTDGPGAAQYASLGTEKSVMIVPAGQVAGDVAFVVPVAVSAHSPLGGGVGELAAWTYAAEGDGPAVPGAGAGHPGRRDGGQCHGAGEPRADSHRRDAGRLGARDPAEPGGCRFPSKARRIRRQARPLPGAARQGSTPRGWKSIPSPGPSQTNGGNCGTTFLSAALTSTLRRLRR